MGDAADMAFDEGFDRWIDAGYGDYEDDDYDEIAINDELTVTRPGRADRACRRCKTRGLSWSKINGRWRLVQRVSRTQFVEHVCELIEPKLTKEST